VRAVDNQGNSSNWSNTAWEYTIPIWSEDGEALAYNNSQNIAIAPDGKICVVWGKNNKIYYSESQDGITWTEDCYIDEGREPTVAIDNNGKKHVVFHYQNQIYYSHRREDGSWGLFCPSSSYNEVSSLSIVVNISYIKQETNLSLELA
jgi:hypothetical protein